MPELQSVVINKLPAKALFKLVFIITTVTLIFLVLILTFLSGFGKEDGPTGSVFGVEYVGYIQAFVHALWAIPLLTLMFSPLVFLTSLISLKIYCWKKPLALVIPSDNVSLNTK